MKSSSSPQPTDAPRFRVSEVGLLLIVLGIGMLWAGPTVVQWLRQEEPKATSYEIEVGPAGPASDLEEDVHYFSPEPEFKLKHPAAPVDAPREENGSGEVESR